MNTTTAIAVFVGYLLFDAAYVSYTGAIVDKRAVKAATVGSAMYLIATYGIINVVDDWRYVFPIVAGSWVGTYVTVKFSKKEPK